MWIVELFNLCHKIRGFCGAIKVWILEDVEFSAHLCHGLVSLSLSILSLVFLDLELILEGLQFALPVIFVRLIIFCLQIGKLELCVLALRFGRSKLICHSIEIIINLLSLLLLLCLSLLELLVELAILL